MASKDLDRVIEFAAEVEYRGRQVADGVSDDSAAIRRMVESRAVEVSQLVAQIEALSEMVKGLDGYAPPQPDAPTPEPSPEPSIPEPAPKARLLEVEFKQVPLGPNIAFTGDSNYISAEAVIRNSSKSSTDSWRMDFEELDADGDITTEVKKARWPWRKDEVIKYVKEGTWQPHGIGPGEEKRVRVTAFPIQGPGTKYLRLRIKSAKLPDATATFKLEGV